MTRVSKEELRDLLKAWVALSLAFAILLSPALFQFSFLFSFLMAGVTVGLGFLLHEAAHKIVAQRYGCFAEFRSFDMMLVLALVMALFGFILAAPGAVMIRGSVSAAQHGKISAAGPGC